MKKRIAWLFILVLSLPVASISADEVDFNRDIRPLLNRQCAACHGGVKMAGDVSFVMPDSILPPEGWVVEPGDPDASVLIERIESDDPDFRMPPPEHGSPLSPEDVELLRRWIEQGAPWRNHWAYEKPELPTVPTVTESDWPRQELDRFVLDRLTRQGIQPSRDESPQRWLRRVTLDLTGLPPTLQDRQTFLRMIESGQETAYETVVDRLLNSPAFGERWASVWLDQVRYADSRGLGIDGRRTIWKYRDWVIDAFNSDMPYSEFTIKQIAGDLLPNATVYDRVATAVHRLSQSNEEGGTDDEEFRVAAVLDRVSTTWQTWQGVTFGCVQCHSHPYDPFTHEEFYEFAAFFNNTRDCDLNDDWPTVQAPIEAEDVPRATELDRQIDALQTSLWQSEYDVLSDASLWRPIEQLNASTNNATRVAVDADQSPAEYYTVDTVSRGTQIQLTAELPPGMTTLTAIRFTGLPLNPAKARFDSEWGFVLSHVEANWVVPGKSEPTPIELARVLIDESDPYYDPQESLNGNTERGFAAFSRINYPRTAAFVLRTPSAIPKGARLEVKLRNDVFILAAFPIVARRGHLAVSDAERLHEIVVSGEQAERREELRELRQRRRAIPSTSVPVLAEREDRFSRPSNVFVRGLFLTKGDEVSPGTPAMLPPLPANQPVDRLALANWLVSAENPLTARVAVNRIWAQLFGVGIVMTEEDFGSSGEAPTYPELLDFLAMRFQNEHGYRFKPLLRELVLSRTYRQSSVIRPELAELDAENRLLARGPRHRLSAEMIRDVALASSGLLTDKLGGQPVRPPIPDGVWKPFEGGDKWETPRVDQPDRYRRSIYTYTKRSIPYPMFATFDRPSREFCTPRRLRSNTPLQALATLNDQTFIECTEGLAKRMIESSNELGEQIRHGFVLVTSRLPSDEEVQDLMALEKTFGADTSHQTAMTAIARVLLNLDEVLTK